jgi:hypothetical protein
MHNNRLTNAYLDEADELYSSNRDVTRKMCDEERRAVAVRLQTCKGEEPHVEGERLFASTDLTDISFSPVGLTEG